MAVQADEAKFNYSEIQTLDCNKQTVQLKFEQKVAYFAFYNTKTEQTEEFWKPKDKPWPTSYTMQQV